MLTIYQINPFIAFVIMTPKFVSCLQCLQNALHMLSQFVFTTAHEMVKGWSSRLDVMKLRQSKVSHPAG